MWVKKISLTVVVFRAAPYVYILIVSHMSLVSVFVRAALNKRPVDNIVWNVLRHINNHILTPS